jgi:uncharacterized membrane-anchored protein YhcB (DUF1043 family)
MELSGEIFGVIVGGILGIVSGVVVTYFTIRFGEKRTKQYISRALLLEVQANQNRLQPLSDSLAKMSNRDIELSEEDPLPNELSFDRTIYSASSDKIGLLDKKSIKKVVPYYVEIKYIEEQYKKLEMIHGVPLGYLLAIELDEIAGYDSNSQRWDEIEKFLRYTEKVYNLGNELTKCLNGEI